MAGGLVAAVAGQEPEPLVEPGADLDHRHHAGPGRGQLDGQRQAAEPLADLDHGRCSRLV